MNCCLAALIQSNNVLQKPDHEQRYWIKPYYDKGVQHGLCLFCEDDDGHDQLDSNDGDSLSCELPSQALEIDERQEDSQAEGVVHTGCSLQGRKGDRHCLGGFLLGVVVGCDEL